MTSSPTVHHFFLAGEPLELWEDPELPFRCTPEEIRNYAMRGNWILLFNALAMVGSPVQRE